MRYINNTKSIIKVADKLVVARKSQNKIQIRFGFSYGLLINIYNVRPPDPAFFRMLEKPVSIFWRSRANICPLAENFVIAYFATEYT